MLMNALVTRNFVRSARKHASLRLKNWEKGPRALSEGFLTERAQQMKNKRQHETGRVGGGNQEKKYIRQKNDKKIR